LSIRTPTASLIADLSNQHRLLVDSAVTPNGEAGPYLYLGHENLFGKRLERDRRRHGSMFLTFIKQREHAITPDIDIWRFKLREYSNCRFRVKFVRGRRTAIVGTCAQLRGSFHVHKNADHVWDLQPVTWVLDRNLGGIWNCVSLRYRRPLLV